MDLWLDSGYVLRQHQQDQPNCPLQCPWQVFTQGKELPKIQCYNYRDRLKCRNSQRNYGSGEKECQLAWLLVAGMSRSMLQQRRPLRPCFDLPKNLKSFFLPPNPPSSLFFSPWEVILILLATHTQASLCEPGDGNNFPPDDN